MDPISAKKPASAAIKTAGRVWCTSAAMPACSAQITASTAHTIQSLIPSKPSIHPAARVFSFVCHVQTGKRRVNSRTVKDLS